jgi:hypothetical protein
MACTTVLLKRSALLPEVLVHFLWFWGIENDGNLPFDGKIPLQLSAEDAALCSMDDIRQHCEEEGWKVEYSTRVDEDNKSHKQCIVLGPYALPNK